MSLVSACYRIVVERGPLGVAEAAHEVSAVAWVPEHESDDRLASSGRARGDDSADRLTFFRSACKPFQALPLVERGHADRWGFGPRELAVMCASHNGAALHVEIVRGILERIGLDESRLLCGFHFPEDPANDARLRAATEVERSPVYNNCSGKHAGMLALAVAEGWPVEDYVAADHPVQRACLAAVAEVCDVRLDQLPLAIDGCSAANPALRLSAMALGFSRLARARDGEAGRDERERALARLRRAMIDHPDVVAGEGRFCTDLMRATRGALVAKGGAEGLVCIGVPSQGAGVALKVHDGGRRAVSPPAIAFLTEMGWLSSDAAKALERWARPVVRNHRGLAVGELGTLRAIEPARAAVARTK